VPKRNFIFPNLEKQARVAEKIIQDMHQGEEAVQSRSFGLKDT
jgi:hypothetical protein